MKFFSRKTSRTTHSFILSTTENSKFKPENRRRGPLPRPWLTHNINKKESNQSNVQNESVTCHDVTDYAIRITETKHKAIQISNSEHRPIVKKHIVSE